MLSMVDSFFLSIFANVLWGLLKKIPTYWNNERNKTLS